MKVIPAFRALALLALAMVAWSPRAEAQITNLDFSIVPSVTSAPVNGQFSYRISLTNQGSILVNLFITNTFSAPIQFFSADIFPSVLASVTTNSNNVTIGFDSVPSSSIRIIDFTIAVTNQVTLVDTVVVRADFPTNLTTTNVTVMVTNVALPVSDLAVSLTGPTIPPLVNDLLNYTVVVTNRGSATASNVFLRNSFLPFSAVKLVSASPSSAFTNSTIVLNLGTLTNNASRTFRLTVQPTNSGVMPFVTSVSSSNITEVNLANNSAANTNTVSPLVFGGLVASNITIMKFNPQTSLMEQKIELMNIGSSNVDSARVMVLGLSGSNWLYNAVGTNNTFGTNANPFVIYGSTLNAGESVILLLEYVVPTRHASDVTNNISYVAVGVGAFDSTSPTGTNSSFEITRLLILTNETRLVEFQSTPGRSYTILYSSTNSFSPTLVVVPNVTAQADRTQWIDDGPPKTVTHPSNAPMRAYRVRLNP